MAFGRRFVEEVPVEETKIWQCTSEDCNGWVRDNFRGSKEASCPLCNSPMEEGYKELAVVQNHSQLK
ncbi:cold-shock protein [Bacillus sp. HMF5848]|uniref:cold-shock protein n=1 Tax=Bacillus sp. HMF5848 TaxID=2495421 RepID=UPI000F78309A|nr:cold-shock protein [Bacillus sp. HMF5848]RSK26666.1 cold-shock protein [Bacillus sp. HMF5848]